MEFFDKLGQKASEAYKVTADKTGKIAKEAKLRIKMGELKSEINDIYEDIGKLVYEKHIREEEYDISKELEEFCIKIDIISDEIESYLKECLELKDRKQCPNCYTEIEKGANFCPECGLKQEKDDVKEVEILNEQKIEQEDNEQEIDNKQQENNETRNESKKPNDGEEKSNLEKTVEVESDVKPGENETVEYFEGEEE